MKIIKKTIAFISALSFAISYNAPSYIAIAEVTANPTKDIIQLVQEKEDVTEPEAEEPTVPTSINIPNCWTSSPDQWDITVSADSELYYKTSPRYIPDKMWGNYTDMDAMLWENGSHLEDGEGFIKFWIVNKTDDQKEAVEWEALPYKYDKTEPNAFSVKRIKHSENRFSIVNSTDISDNISSDLKAYYVINNSGIELKNRTDIESKGTWVPLYRYGTGFRFAVNGDPSMIGNCVDFYVIDEAGNIQHTSIDIKNDPSLCISGIEEDKNKWCNTLNWMVTSEPVGDTKIYFKTSEKNRDDWGDPNEAELWDPEWKPKDLADIIPEKDHYIHFWAAYDNEPDYEVAERTLHYNFDKTKPTELAVSMSEPFWPSHDNIWRVQRTFKTKFPFYEDGSGIATVAYKLGDETEHMIDYSESEGGYTFSTNLELDRQLANNPIVFIVRDKANNEQTYTINKLPGIKPVINNISVVHADKIEDLETASPKSSLVFGSERSTTNPYSKAIYANDDDYIKLDIDDPLLSKIYVNVNNKKQLFSFENQEAIDKNGIIVQCEGTNNRRKKCYIPVSKIGGLADQETNTISFLVMNYTKSSVAYLLDPNKTKCDIFYDRKGSNVSFSADPVIIDGKNYYGGKSFSEKITVTLNDDIGLKKYKYDVIDPNGDVVDTFTSDDLSAGTQTDETIEINDENAVADEEDATTATEDISYNVPITSMKEPITIDSEKYTVNGLYHIEVSSVDLAGNITNKSEGTFEFYIDTQAPTVTEDKYHYDPSVLKYYNFGIFGNDSVSITIKGSDNDFGCGISDDNVSLKWGAYTYKADSVFSNGKYKEFIFDSLPLRKSGKACFMFEDVIGNNSKYYLTIKDGVVSNDVSRSTSLELEDIKPSAEIKLPKKNQYNINGEIWYPSGIDYKVFTSDKQSGLNNLSVVVKDSNNNNTYKKYSHNEDGRFIKDKYVKFSDEKEKYTDRAIYTYNLDTEGHFTIIADSQDNAGNYASENTDDRSIANRKKVIHIDTRDPEITEFKFETESEQGNDVECSTYGYYFKEDTIIRVYVKDEDVSSGINYVTLYRCESGKKDPISTTVYASETKNWNAKESYAEFKIEKGFKGQIWAIVVDNVASPDFAKDNYKHTSGLRYINGTIVEDGEIHSNVSSIRINEASGTYPSNVYRENNSEVEFYNNSVPLVITVADSFSGIAEIDWSIAKDNKKGTILVDNDGNIRTTGNEVTIIDESIKREANLITELQFMVTVASENNDNLVSVNMTDRANNRSEAATTKSYNLDKTKPVIKSSITSETDYYNGDQEIVVTINEKNFNPKDVMFTLTDYKPGENDELIPENRQVELNWSSESDIHTGTFRITDDGTYSYAVSYVDMAGNTGNTDSHNTFVVDKTIPVVETNFSKFETANGENYVGMDQSDLNAVITITERNFDPEGANIEIKRKNSGEKHDKDGMEKEFRGSWSTDPKNKDKHIFTIPFCNRNEDGQIVDPYDGIYVISVSPVDKALNKAASRESAIFEIDFTNPVISQRNGNDVTGDEDPYNSLEIYTEKSEIDENFVPSVEMTDNNLDRIEYSLTVYTPEFTSGKEIGVIEPTMTTDAEIKQVVEKVSDKGNSKCALFTLPEFAKDGIYSYELTAVDKAGNRSLLCRNTSVLMKRSDVLAYITDSKKADTISESTGWYSLQKDEKTPISKRPDDFKDLNITVFAPTDSETNIILRDQNGKIDDTGLTADNSTDMYAVGVYNYTLPNEFFVDNYPEGTNKDLYLRVENTYHDETSNTSLAWIRIDALAPTCTVPNDLKKGRSFIRNSKTYTITNISESLDPAECKVYDNGELMTNFTYSESDKTLSYTLSKGRHDLSFVLVDEAGNTYTVQEVSFIQVGLLYCLWFRILMGVLIVAFAVCGIVFIRNKTAHI